MRTLIIDNYDSFTYNLFHYVGEVTGVAPVVVRNDDDRFTIAELDRFDNVIISPGPGRPDRPADFGICTEVIRASTVPLLGVCLGYQGMCHVLGGTVGPAPQVRHGQGSPVLHDQVDILAGLPSPFFAVRYHSLVATSLPDELEAIASTEDGVLMAVRHRHRPMWGVQFHPESICTEHGHRLLANFADLTRRWRATTPAALSPPPPVSQRPRIDVPAPADGLRLLHRRLALRLPAENVFAELYRGSAESFWLDSSRQDVPQGRFSFMGDATGPLARVARADVWSGRITVESAGGVEVVHGSFLDWIDNDLRAHRVRTAGLPFEFALGWVGYLGYELKAECGGTRAHRSTVPDAAMIFADRAVAFDHNEDTIYLLALADAGDQAGAEQWLADTTALLTRLAARPATPGPPAGQQLPVGPLRPRHDRARYLELIAACQEEIQAGETYEVCLTNMLVARGKLDALASYRGLRQHNPAPFAALLTLGQLSVLSCSPERFLRVSVDGIAESKPIKGTRPRSADPAIDAELRADLATNVKDRAENLMIVDLVRNDLGVCAELGTVGVDNLFDVESYATVHQLVSTIRARLRPDRTAVDCVRAAFPGGSMTGAPKIRTMQLIDELEEGPRGVYSGAIGYFSLTGAADFNIVIRTVVAGQDEISYGVGGAIIALSEPDAEFEETVVKATPLLRLLDQDFPGTTTPPALGEVA